MENGNNEEKLVHLNDLLADFLTPNTAVLFIYLLIGVLGNSIVVYVYIFRIKGNKDDRFFIPYLAVCDLISCLFGAGFAIALNMLPANFRGDALCKSLWFLTKWTTLISGLVLVVIALQRFQKVCRPFGRQMTLPMKYVSICVTVILSGVVAFPTLIFHGEITFHNEEANITGYRCGRYESMDLSNTLTIYNTVQLLIALVGILSVTVLYTFIGKKIYAQTRFRKRHKSRTHSCVENSQMHISDSGVVRDNDEVFTDHTKGNGTGKKVDEARKYSKDSVYSTDDEEVNTKRKNSVDYVDEKGRRKSTKLRLLNLQASFRHFRYSLLFMLITIIFLVTYAPRMTIMLLEGIDNEFWENLTYNEIRSHLFLYRFYIVNNVVNPFIYSLFDSKFKKEIKIMVCCCRRETK